MNIKNIYQLIKKRYEGIIKGKNLIDLGYYLMNNKKMKPIEIGSLIGDYLRDRRKNKKKQKDIDLLIDLTHFSENELPSILARHKMDRSINKIERWAMEEAVKHKKFHKTYSKDIWEKIKNDTKSVLHKRINELIDNERFESLLNFPEESNFKLARKIIDYIEGHLKLREMVGKSLQNLLDKHKI